jgi:hypothetical protein
MNWQLCNINTQDKITMHLNACWKKQDVLCRYQKLMQDHQNGSSNLYMSCRLPTEFIWIHISSCKEKENGSTDLLDTLIYLVTFQVLTATGMNMTVFRDVSTRLHGATSQKTVIFYLTVSACTWKSKLKAVHIQSDMTALKRTCI